MTKSTSNGILLLNKPSGVTSFTALYPVKSIFGRRVGHAGTLDKFAEGLLIVLIGRFTRLNQVFSDLDKEYTALFRFGLETDTLDPEGSIIAKAPLPTESRITDACRAFIGDIDQIPPAYSAVHVDGKRAYREVRKGNTPEMRPRRITIRSCIVESWNPPFLEVSIRCSKGTYIRSLARDIGKASGSCAYVQSLKRTSIGPFRLQEAAVPDSLRTEDIHADWDFFSRLSGFYRSSIDTESVRGLTYGRMPELSIIPDDDSGDSGNGCDLYALLTDGQDNTVAVVRLLKSHGRLVPEKLICGFPPKE